MGIHDRPYMQDESPGGGGVGRGGLTFGLPRPGQTVKYLVGINVAVFVAQMFFDRSPYGHSVGVMTRYLGVTVGSFWQVWRYITFQFLHAGFWHILLNMLGLYLLGSPLEGRFGSRWFLRFYLSCGVVAGLAYVVIGALANIDPRVPIIGASGGVYGVVLAAAAYFPSFQIIFLFFPVPIRLAALIIFGGMIAIVLRALSYGQVERALSDVAHLGGAATAAVWIWLLPRLRGAPGRVSRKLSRGAWERKMQRQAADQAEIDRILQKIHDQGLASLTGKEKKILREATECQRREEQDFR